MQTQHMLSLHKAEPKAGSKSRGLFDLLSSIGAKFAKESAQRAAAKAEKVQVKLGY